ncbi:ABC transporter substrate-binding protein [Pseudodesulfovibrio sp. zrk46]|uniref:ABC transporter substrate-binding protein n=1 Tax=Pseudodesulfovibrio sp. zrk46 TaxID=2725288 RepID=UPI001449F144|nr:ABC transporter substrate-binding protein [Pseudodesulfovibrio sp. zrk46]QJB54939.1 ABC transporter substrate-binding protein [Pseudodesulfovibrio sp. zrk46]
MKKIVLAMALMLLFSMSAHAENTKIRFGILPVLDTLPLQVAVQDGLFIGQGLDVELVRFASALERDTALQAGQLDGYFGDLIAACMLVNKNVPMYVALTSWRTTPGFPMFGIAQSPAKKGAMLGAMQGASLGLSKSTIMEFLADKISDSLGIGHQYFEQIEIKKMPIRLQMLLTDQVDCALLPEPLLSLAKFKGGGVLVTAEKLNIPLTVLSLHRKFFLDGADTYIRFITAYKEAVKRLRNDPEKYRQLMAETCRIPGPLVAEFPIYPYPMPSLPTTAELDEVQEWMVEKGMLKRRLPHELMLSPIIP